MWTKHNGVNIFPVDMFFRKLLAEISKPWIQSLTFGDHWTLNRWPQVKSERNTAIENFESYWLFLKIVSSYDSSSSRPKNTNICIFPQNLIKICNINSIDPEDIHLRSPKLHAIEFFNHATSHKDVMILAFIGAELAGGAESAPLPGRVILNPIPGRGLTWSDSFALAERTALLPCRPCPLGLGDDW